MEQTSKQSKVTFRMLVLAAFMICAAQMCKSPEESCYLKLSRKLKNFISLFAIRIHHQTKQGREENNLHL